MRNKRPLKHYIVGVQFNSGIAPDSPYYHIVPDADIGYFLVQATYPGQARDKVAKACGWADMEDKYEDWSWPTILFTRIIHVEQEVQRI